MMSDEKIHSPKAPSSATYPSLVRKRVTRKKNRLFRTSLIEGQTLAIKEAEPFLNRLQHAFQKVHSAKVAAIAQHAEDLIFGYLQRHPHTIVKVAVNLLRNIAEHTDVEITASKTDADILRTSLNEIALAFASARKVTIIDDHTFKRGSLVIKAHKSIVDAHVKTQITKAKDLVLLRSKELNYGTVD